MGALLKTNVLEVVGVTSSQLPVADPDQVMVHPGRADEVIVRLALITAWSMFGSASLVGVSFHVIVQVLPTVIVAVPPKLIVQPLKVGGFGRVIDQMSGCEGVVPSNDDPVQVTVT